MNLKPQLAKLENEAYRRARPKPPQPRVCLDCGQLARPLDRPLQPYSAAPPRCRNCAWSWMGQVIQVLEECGAGPSAAAQAYAAECDLPVSDALDRLVEEKERGRVFTPEENMLAMACTFAE